MFECVCLVVEGERDEKGEGGGGGGMRVAASRYITEGFFFKVSRREKDEGSAFPPRGDKEEEADDQRRL